MRTLTLIPTTLALAAALASCAPAATSTGPSWADRTFAPGQKWVVEAFAAEGNETVLLTLGKKEDNSIYRSYSSTQGRTEAVLNYGPANPRDGSSEFINVIWKSSPFKDYDRHCAVRNPSMTPDPQMFSGRYAWSYQRAVQYRDTGNTEGTSTCTLRRIE